MKVFISWSGEQSRLFGEAIRDWLPAVLQKIRPYFTPADIEKGNRWSTDIAKELDSSSAGIFCLTRDNLESQWLMFEAGAISKRVDKTLVCPILFNLSNSDLKGPLTQFQTTEFNKNEIKKLINSLNRGLDTEKLEEKVLHDVFEMWWPRLEEKVASILEKRHQAHEPELRTDRDILEEILSLSRIMGRNVKNLRFGELSNLKQIQLNKLLSDFLLSFRLVFEDDWEHTKSSLTDDWMPIFIYENGTFLNPRVTDESNNWSNRGGLLDSYRSLLEFIAVNKINIGTDYSDGFITD
ncbi:MAG: toll/interleukin-1 receptor domain-containing protein [Desulfuromonadaceae bacterium]